MPFVARPAAALVFLLAAIALVPGALAPGAQAQTQGQTQAKPAIPADAPIRRMALIPCPEPTEFAAITQQSGLIWAIINADNNEKMTAAMTADQVRIGERITAAVEAQLRAANFEVVHGWAQCRPAVPFSPAKPHFVPQSWYDSSIIKPCLTDDA